MKIESPHYSQNKNFEITRKVQLQRALRRADGVIYMDFRIGRQEIWAKSNDTYDLMDGGIVEQIMQAANLNSIERDPARGFMKRSVTLTIAWVNNRYVIRRAA